MRRDVTRLISELKEEHMSILQRLKQLTDSFQGDDLHLHDARHSDLMQNFAYALEQHLRKEERLFFPILREAANGDKPVESMRDEHRLLKASLRRLRETNATRSSIEGFGEMLRKHISREQNVLFWLVEVRASKRR